MSGECFILMLLLAAIWGGYIVYYHSEELGGWTIPVSFAGGCMIGFIMIRLCN